MLPFVRNFNDNTLQEIIAVRVACTSEGLFLAPLSFNTANKISSIESCSKGGGPCRAVFHSDLELTRFVHYEYQQRIQQEQVQTNQ